MPSSRDACHQMIDNAINNACQADALVGEPGFEFFSSSEAIERFAGRSSGGRPGNAWRISNSCAPAATVDKR